MLYGGAAGGGKSDALLMAGLQYVEIPEYRGLLLRRTYGDLSLPGALMDRAHTWLDPSPATFNANMRQWTFPSGATMTFGHLAHEAQKRRYQSSEFHYIGFDELCQFSETQYTYLLSRVRRQEGSPIPCRMRAGANPDGPGLLWVKARFVDEETNVDPETGLRRRFIPATLNDNPYLDQADYRLSLMALDPVTRARLLGGDWEARDSGGYFKREWFGDLLDEMPRETVRGVRFWDLASTEATANTDPDWTAGCLMARGLDSELFYTMDMRRARDRPAQIEKLIKNTAQADGKDVAIRMEQEPGASGKALIAHYARRVLPEYNFLGVPSLGSKEQRAAPLSSQCEIGNVIMLRGSFNRALFEELEAFPTPGAKKDQVDAMSGAYKVLAGGSLLRVQPTGEVPKQARPKMAGVRRRVY